MAVPTIRNSVRLTAMVEGRGTGSKSVTSVPDTLSFARFFN